MKYRKSALVASISFIFLFSLSLFLYSCGVNSPSNVSNSTTGISRLSAAAIDIDSSSGAAKNIPAGQNFGIQALTVSSTGLTTITFDEYPLGTFIATQYASSGVIFSSGAGGTPVIVNDRANPTSPVLSGWPLGYGPITITFTDPNNASKSVLASNVSFDAGYFNALGSTVVTFYDINGNAVGSQTDTIYGFQHFTIPGSVNKVSIVIISFEPGGYCMDNLAFSASGTASSSKPPLPPPPPKPGKLVVSPDKATIYVHPIAPAKGNQQYMAVDDKGNNVTNSVAWQWDNPIVAKIDATGLATPLSPGSTVITAVLDKVTSNIANLKVACWDHKYWLQNDERWYNELYANYKAATFWMYDIGNKGDVGYRRIFEGTIGGTGCTTACMSMAISTSGTSYNPYELNRDMKKDGYYKVDNTVKFDAMVAYSNGVIKSWHYANKNTIKSELDNCNFVIVEIPASLPGGHTHWVYITGYKDNTYYILNPANTTKTEMTPDKILGNAESVVIGVIN